MSEQQPQSPQSVAPEDRAFLQDRRRALRAQLSGLNIQRQGVIAELHTIEKRLDRQAPVSKHPLTKEP